jgi:hypothetical protein
MRTSTLLIAFVLGLVASVTAHAQTTRPAEPALEELEKQFEQALTGATLAGFFTQNDSEPKPDRYTISSVKKLPLGDRWLLTARIQYGDKDVTVPVIVPVKFAADTPVITVTDLPIPGMGTYWARVMIYRDRYAGTWGGGGHEGHLWGKIERK